VRLSEYISYSIDQLAPTTIIIKMMSSGANLLCAKYVSQHSNQMHFSYDSSFSVHLVPSVATVTYVVLLRSASFARRASEQVSRV
jgi:hypothetical protein